MIQYKRIDTFYEPDGSMNNRFGREEVLDTLAHKFMECVWMNVYRLIE